MAYPIPFNIVALGVLIIINSHDRPLHQVLLWSAFGLSVLSFVSVSSWTRSQPTFSSSFLL